MFVWIERRRRPPLFRARSLSYHVLLTFFINRSTVFDRSESWPIDGVLDALAAIGSGAPDARWGPLLAAGANSTIVVVSARAAFVLLIVVLGFITHLRILYAYAVQFTTKKQMDDDLILDERMDADNERDNERDEQRLPLQDQNAAKGLPFPHIEDSHGQYTVQYIDMYALFLFLFLFLFLQNLETADRLIKRGCPTSAIYLASNAVGINPLLSSVSVNSAATGIYGKGKPFSQKISVYLRH